MKLTARRSACFISRIGMIALAILMCSVMLFLSVSSLLYTADMNRNNPAQEKITFIGKLDALVLGCTHYPFVTRNIASIMGPGTQLLHGGKGTARETKRRLEKAGLLNEGPGSVILLNSSDNPKMLKLAQSLLNGEKISFED